MKKFQHFGLIAFLLLAGCEPDVAPRLSTPIAAQHLSASDPYDYLKDPDHPDTVAYMRAERDYLLEATQDWSGLRAELESEINRLLPARVKSLPLVIGDYEYFHQIPATGEFPVFYRRSIGAGKEAEVLLDQNQLAAGQAFHALGNFVVNPDEKVIAFTEDLTGAQQYRLSIGAIGGEATYQVLIDNVASDIAWRSDGLAIYCLSSDRRFLYSVDIGSGEKAHLYYETDAAFHLSLREARGSEDVLLSAESHETTQLFSVNRDSRVIPFTARKPGHRYRVRVAGDRQFALTNQPDGDFQMVEILGGNDWVAIGYDGGGFVRDFDVLARGLLVHVSDDLAERIDYRAYDADEWVTLIRGDKGESLKLGTVSPESVQIRVQRQGLNLPPETIAINLDDASQVVLEQQELMAGVSLKNYQVDRLWVETAPDVRVPVTLLYNKRFKGLAGPVYLTAYGAYGRNLPMHFDTTRFPLLDQGFIFAFAHVRGGGELGTSWHEDGKGRYKHNGVNDLIGVANHLVEKGVVGRGKLFARGRSAGGALVAMAARRAPGLFNSIVLQVPFLDVLHTLSDEGAALTPADHLEWGNPSNPDDYDYLKQLSPYEQVGGDSFPGVLIQAAANDSRVGVHESLRWLAKMRAQFPGHPALMIDIEHNSGHLGASDQGEIRASQSLEYAFLINQQK